METREITQVKVYSLLLNPITDRWESTQIAAIATDKQKLINFYKEQLSDEGWKDDRFHKSFKQGSPLEWFNQTDLNYTDSYGRGIKEEWVNEETFYVVKNRFYFVE